MTSEAERGQPRPARQWYVEADRCYVEEHQGCPCCHGRHCVFRARWGSRTEYQCIECDFSAAHDDQNGTYAAVPGRAAPARLPAVLEELWRAEAS